MRQSIDLCYVRARALIAGVSFDMPCTCVVLQWAPETALSWGRLFGIVRRPVKVSRLHSTFDDVLRSVLSHSIDLFHIGLRIVRWVAVNEQKSKQCSAFSYSRGQSTNQLYNWLLYFLYLDNGKFEDIEREMGGPTQAGVAACSQVSSTILKRRKYKIELHNTQWMLVAGRWSLVTFMLHTSVCVCVCECIMSIICYLSDIYLTFGWATGPHMPPICHFLSAHLF